MTHPGVVFIRREISDGDKKVLMLLSKELVKPHLKPQGELSFLCLGMRRSNWSGCKER